MISRKPWELKDVGRLSLAIVATLCFGMVLASSVTKFHLSLSESQIEFVQMMISITFFQVSALIWINFFIRQFGISWKEAFGLATSEPMTVAAYGVLAGVLFLPVAWLLQSFSEKLMDLVNMTPEPQSVVQVLQDPSLSLGCKSLFGAAAVILAPVAEETIFRGILYPVIKQRGFPRVALWGTSAVFALMHANAATFVPLLAFAMLLVFLYESFGNLLAPIVAHAVFNSANFLILVFHDKLDRFLHSS